MQQQKEEKITQFDEEIAFFTHYLLVKKWGVFENLSVRSVLKKEQNVVLL